MVGADERRLPNGIRMPTLIPERVVYADDDVEMSSTYPRSS